MTDYGATALSGEGLIPPRREKPCSLLQGAPFSGEGLIILPPLERTLRRPEPHPASI